MAADEVIFRAALISLYALIPPTYASLQFLTVPYGKHYRSGWGPALRSPVAWAVMESPALLLPILLLPFGRHAAEPIAWVLMAPFVVHYFHRTVVYPRYLKGGGAPIPLFIALLAFFFNLLNGYLQIRWVSHYADYRESGLGFWARVAAGMAVFCAGMAANIRCDRALIALRRRGGYALPTGELFELVTCPNYLGEAVEWLGWAVMTWSWPALGFFLYTAANLVPRARAHRRWYSDKFTDEFPTSRPAILPFLY